MIRCSKYILGTTAERQCRKAKGAKSERYASQLQFVYAFYAKSVKGKCQPAEGNGRLLLYRIPVYQAHKPHVLAHKWFYEFVARDKVESMKKC